MRIKRFKNILKENLEFENGCHLYDDWGDKDLLNRLKNTVNYDFSRIENIIDEQILIIEKCFGRNKIKTKDSITISNKFPLLITNFSIKALDDNYFYVNVVINFINLHILCDDTYGLENLGEFVVKTLKDIGYRL